MVKMQKKHRLLRTGASYVNLHVRRSNEPGEPNGVTIITAFQARIVSGDSPQTIAAVMMAIL